MTKPKKLTKPVAGKNMEQKELSSIAGKNAKWYSRFGRVSQLLTKSDMFFIM